MANDDIFAGMPSAAGPSAPTAPTAQAQGDIFSGMPAAGASPPPAGPEADIFSSMPGTPADKPLRSYFGASLRSGLQSTAALGAEALGSLTAPTSKRDLITLYKDNPEGFQTQWDGLAYAPLRLAEDLQRRSTATMNPEGMTPRGQELAQREYFTLDPSKSALTAGLAGTPERLAGDVLQSASTALGIGAAVVGSRFGGPRGAMVAGGTAGGALEGGGQYLQVREALEQAPLPAWEKIPRFKELIAEGYRPQMARLAAIEEAASAAGIQSGMAATVIDALGGKLLGHITEAPAPILSRFGRGAGTEATTEGLQSAEQQVTQNQALARTINPEQDIFEGLGEAAVQGAVVGGLLGGAGAAAGGRGPARAPVGPEPTVPGSVDNNVGNIINKDGTGFLSAPTPEAGVAMTIRNVQAYPGQYNNGQPMTLRQIAYKWAPPDDGKTPMLRGNNPDNWAKVVADSMGLSPDTPIDVNDPAVAAAFAKGVHRIEKGAGKLFGDEVYNQGASIAFSGASLPSMASDPVLKGVQQARDMALSDSALDADLNLFVDEEAATKGEDEIKKATSAADNPEMVEATSEPLETTKYDLDPVTGEVLQKREQVGQLPQADPAAAKASAVATAVATNENVEKLNQLWKSFKTEPGKYPRTDLGHVLDRIRRGGGEEALQRQHLDVLDKEVTEALKYATDSTEKEVAWREVADSFLETVGKREGEFGRAQFGRSPEAMQTVLGTPNPNNSIALANLPVAESLRLGQIGRKVREVALKGGEVIGVGVPTEHYPAEFFRDTVRTTRDLLRLIDPTSRVRILVTPLTRGMAGIQSFMRRMDPKANFYIINPRNMTRIDQIKGNSYNSTTRAQFMYGLVHELGHVLVEDRFLGDLPEDIQTSLRKIGQTDPFELIPEALIAQLPPERAAIAREFNEKKARLLGPGSKATLGDWLKEMGSPSVMVQGLGQLKEVTARAFADMYFKPGAWDEPARKWVGRWHEDGWPAGSLHEYLSDQLARYAHNKNLLAKTTLGKTNWFKDLWSQIKEFFGALKEAGLVPKIAGEKAFERWVKSLASKPSNRGQGAAQKVPIGRLGQIRTDSNALPEASSMEAAEAGIQIRNLPGVSEDARGEALEMLARGQVEAAKELVEESAQSSTIIRWASNGPAYAGLQQQIDQLARAKGGPWQGLRPWLASGWRKLAELMDFAVNVREFAFRDPTNVGAQFINLTLTQYKAYKNALEKRSMDNVVDALSKQPGKQQRRIFDLLQKEWEGGQHWTVLAKDAQGNWEHQMTPKLVQEAQAEGLVPESVRLFLAIKNEYLYRQQQLHLIMRTQLQAKLQDAIANGRVASAAYYMKQIRSLYIGMSNMRNVPFLPMTRFGQEILEVRDQTGKVVHVEAYESKENRARARQRLAAHQSLAGYSYRERTDDSTSSVLRVLPLENLSTTSAAFGLTPRQLSNLRARIDPITASPLTRKYSVPLGKISGHSRNQLRTFADFMHHDSLVLSKLLFREQFREGLRMVDESIEAANHAGDSARVATLEHGRSYLGKSIQQILNPAHEYHLLRSIVVLKQLAFSIKTALLNFSSLVNTWAIATTRVGLVKGTVEVNKAFAQSFVDVMNRAQQDMMGRVLSGPANLSPEDRRAVSLATQHGLLQETYAADLAHLAGGDLLDRFNLPQTVGLQESVGKYWRGVLRLGMLPQRLVEETARQTTFMTLFRLYRKQGMSFDDAYNAAKTDTEMTQGDNSIESRAPMLRGPLKSAVLIYYNFMRNMLWQLSGGYERGRRRREATIDPTTGQTYLPRSRNKYSSETVKMWLVYGFLGGIMGLPGAEDLDNIVEQVARLLFGSRVSLKEEAYELASWIANNAHDIGLPIEPRSIVRGALSDLGGFDISGSIGLGSALPGLGGVDRLGEDGGKFLTESLGPAGRELQNILNIFDEGLPWQQRAALFIPTVLNNVLKGVEPDPKLLTGARIAVDPETGAVRSLSTGELVGQWMGFTPTIVSVNREIAAMQADTRRYWTTRRNMLTAALLEAKISREQDAIHDTLKSISEFNALAPPGMALTQESIKRSIQTREQRVRQQEVGSAPQRMLRPEFGRVRTLVVGAPEDGGS